MSEPKVGTNKPMSTFNPLIASPGTYVNVSGSGSHGPYRLVISNGRLVQQDGLRRLTTTSSALHQHNNDVVIKFDGSILTESNGNNYMQIGDQVFTDDIDSDNNRPSSSSESWVAAENDDVPGNVQSTSAALNANNMRIRDNLLQKLAHAQRQHAQIEQEAACLRQEAARLQRRALRNQRQYIRARERADREQERATRIAIRQARAQQQEQLGNDMVDLNNHMQNMVSELRSELRHVENERLAFRNIVMRRLD
ncbi:MAG: hypothetical protein Q9227_001234 [Pyrenula ochraceoflavens]